MLMQNVAWPGTPKGLDYLSSLYCDYHKYWKGEGKEWNPKIPEEVLWSYNCKDAVTTFESEAELANVIKFFGLKEQLAMQMQQFPMILNMMLRGVAVDTKRRAKLNMELMEAAAQREKRLEYLIPSDVFPRKAKASPWYRSPKQQMELFYEVLGQEVIRHRKTYKPTVDDEAIATIATRTPILRPLIEIIQEYRSIGVFHSNFIQAPLDPDGRIRSSFDPAGTETYRWASRKNAYGRGTNFQNIPEGSEE
jgi:DNA polymerase I-like protein with 3'-5' exonuclease and polymerase domains